MHNSDQHLEKDNSNYLFIDAALEERSQRCVHQDSIIQFSRSAGNVNGLHLLKTTKRMTFANQLRDGSLVQGSSDQEDNVVNHVAIGDVVQEHGQGPRGLVPHVLELCHQLLPQLLVNDGHLEAALIGQEVAVVCGLEVELQIFQSLALHQVQVIIVVQDS